MLYTFYELFQKIVLFYLIATGASDLSIICPSNSHTTSSDLGLNQKSNLNRKREYELAFVIEKVGMTGLCIY